MNSSNQMQHGEICRMPHDKNGYFGWPSIARMDDGTLIAGASGYRHNHICPWGVTTLFISRDNGETWSEPIVIHDSPLDDRDVGLVSLKNQIVMATWFTLDPRQFRDGFEKWPDEDMKNRMRARLSALTDTTVKEHSGSWTRVSFDSGKTWSEPRRCPVSSPHGPILMKNGSLLYLGKQFSGNLTRPWGEVAAAVSIDYGATWKEIGTVPLPEGCRVDQVHEPHVCEMPDGRLVGVLRVHDAPFGTTWLTESTDGGRTWSNPVPMPVKSVPAHLMLHSGGTLVCTYGYRHEPYGQHVIFSNDEGRTWIHDMPLREDGPDHDLGYPGTVELGDGSLLTVYYQKAEAGENTSILYTRWHLPEDL